jgi:S1-C subfamily serine protease
MRKNSGILIIILSVIFGVASQSEGFMEMGGTLTYEKSVVMLRCAKQDFDYTTPWKQMPMSQGVGSGFVISGNRILTNAHNVSNYRYLEVKKQNLAKRYIGKVEFVGHDCDLAIIRIAEPGFFDDMVALEVGDIPAVNSTVQTYGFPMGGRQVSVTEGVVSRIEMTNYSHTQADGHLVVQTDAAINPGNSGGPVLQNGKIVGVAFQGITNADNIGYMIPTTVINHFLKDIEEGKYDGFGSFGFSFYAGLHSKAYAEYLQVPEGVSGVVVLSTMLNSSVEGVFEKGDVMTKVDGYDVDNDGMIKIYGLTLSLGEAIEAKQIGDKVMVEFYRGGELKTAEVEVALNRPVVAFSREYDIAPRYEVFAGLTFVPMTRNFLETWGRNWVSDMPHYLRYLFVDSGYLNKNRDLKEYVILSEILADEVNSYAGVFENGVVTKVNGIEINGLDDLRDAFEAEGKSFCTIEFMGSSTPLILDYKKAKARDAIILDKYKVPAKNRTEAKL